MRKIAWHRVIICLGVIGLAVYLTVNLFSANKEEVICKGIDVKIKNKKDAKLITSEDVADIITSSRITATGKALNDSVVKKVKTLLDTKSYIKDAVVYRTGDSVLHVELEQRIPVVRIVTNTGSCYLDDEGYAFPPSLRYSYNVPLVTGNVPLPHALPYKGPLLKKSDFVQDILMFANFLSKNSFWNAQIQQINVDNDKNIEFVTCTDDILIRLGQFNNFEEKLENLYAFYKKVIPNDGSKYEILDLRFNKQIVAVKKQNQITDSEIEI